MGGCVMEWEEQRLIRRYEVDGAQYLEIANWLEHQKIDRPSKSRLPSFDEGSRVVAKDREASTTDLGPSTLDLGPKESCAVAPATRTPDRFEDFWKAYPKREGASGKAQARKKFLSLVKSGLDPGALIVAAAKYAEEARKSGQFGTPYVAMARTWLNQQRYDDYRSPPADTGPPKPPHADLPSHEELLEKYGKSDRPTATETIVRSEPDHTGKLRQNGTETCSGVGRDGVSGIGARQPGMRGLGEIFRPPPGGQTVGLQGADERENPGHDGSDPVARMV